MKKLKIGTVIGNSTLETAESKHLRIPDPDKLIHLQFRRFAGCPFCSLHLRSFDRRHDAIAAAGIHEVVVFRSTAAALKRHYSETPFTLIPDREGMLYTQFGVDSGLQAVLNPRAWGAAIRGVVGMLPKLPGLPPWGNGALGLPADFLIASDGRVLACKYGTHANDQWSVDDLLALARKQVTQSRSIGIAAQPETT